MFVYNTSVIGLFLQKYSFVYRECFCDCFSFFFTATSLFNCIRDVDILADNVFEPLNYCGSAGELHEQST